MMRKVVVTTFFKAENYGAELQAYALQAVIRQHGYDVEILNYRDATIEDAYKIIDVQNKNLYWTVKSFVGCILFCRRRYKRHKAFLKFQQQYLRIGTKEYWSAEEIKQNPPEADVYITGSDQVWNTSITKGISDIYTLNFGYDNICRIAYAASIGTNIFPKSETNDFIKKTARIDRISVREATAKKALKDCVNGKSIDVVLDPVLLRNRKEWETDIAGFIGNKDKYILVYFIEEDQEYRKIAKCLSKVTGLKMIHFEQRNKFDNVLRNAFTDGPLEFVNLIKNAEYVVTTSFHGTAFSIVLHKKFWVVPNGVKASRITDLLDKLNLQDRAVHKQEEFETKDYNQKIEYEKVDMLLEEERQKSLKWLSTALGENVCNAE